MYFRVEIKYFTDQSDSKVINVYIYIYQFNKMVIFNLFYNLYSYIV